MNTPMESELYGLAKMVGKWIADGLKVEAIQARLADPSGVAADLLAQAVARKAKGKAYLGREPNTHPNAVMVEVEDHKPAVPSRNRSK